MAELPPITSLTVERIYQAYENEAQAWDSAGLSPSSMGTECDRALWYEFRWAAEKKPIEGRKLRLFQTGHREESRMVEDLRRAGVTVLDVDPDTGKQWAVRALGGHVRGKADGACVEVPEAPKTWHLLEIKTHNDKSFKALKRDGVLKAKPGHYAQMQEYMGLLDLKRALYMAANKNDDEIYTERVEFDPVYFMQLMARAERIITADRPPSKAHEDPESKAAFACGWCPAKEVCHFGSFARSHCRTCLHATPIIDDGEDGRWHCARRQKDLTYNEQKVGCAHHLFIPDLVPGEQIDADEKAQTVTYRLNDGAIWTDGPQNGGAA